MKIYFSNEILFQGGERSSEVESSLDGCSDVGTYSDSIDASDNEDDIDEFVDDGENAAEAGEQDLWINERRHSGDGEVNLVLSD